LRAQLEARLARYRRRLTFLEQAEDEIPRNPRYEAAVRIHRAVIDAEREELLRLRDTGGLSDSGLRVLERELDHQEVLLPPSAGG
jgi:CPA1 family monovalent cation:H+ antiporter